MASAQHHHGKAISAASKNQSEGLATRHLLGSVLAWRGRRSGRVAVRMLPSNHRVGVSIVVVMSSMLNGVFMATYQHHEASSIINSISANVAMCWHQRISIRSSASNNNAIMRWHQSGHQHNALIYGEIIFSSWQRGVSSSYPWRNAAMHQRTRRKAAASRK